MVPSRSGFQSLDWVDVDFDLQRLRQESQECLFQSLDWVDVDFDQLSGLGFSSTQRKFQSLDWVDVDFDEEARQSLGLPPFVSIPRLG